MSPIGQAVFVPLHLTCRKKEREGIEDMSCLRVSTGGSNA